MPSLISCCPGVPLLCEWHSWAPGASANSSLVIDYFFAQLQECKSAASCLEQQCCQMMKQWVQNVWCSCSCCCRSRRYIADVPGGSAAYKWCEKKTTSVSLAGCIYVLVLMFKVWSVLRSWLLVIPLEETRWRGLTSGSVHPQCSTQYPTTTTLPSAVQTCAQARQHFGTPGTCPGLQAVSGVSHTLSWPPAPGLVYPSYSLPPLPYFTGSSSPLHAMSLSHGEKGWSWPQRGHHHHLPTDDLWPLTPAEFPILLGLLESPAPPTAADKATEQSRGAAGAVSAVWG